jgi:hypothetical protein
MKQKINDIDLKYAIGQQAVAQTENEIIIIGQQAVDQFKTVNNADTFHQSGGKLAERYIYHQPNNNALG